MRARTAAATAQSCSMAIRFFVTHECWKNKQEVDKNGAHAASPRGDRPMRACGGGQVSVTHECWTIKKSPRPRRSRRRGQTRRRGAAHRRDVWCKLRAWLVGAAWETFFSRGRCASAGPASSREVSSRGVPKRDDQREARFSSQLLEVSSRGALGRPRRRVRQCELRAGRRPARHGALLMTMMMMNSVVVSDTHTRL